MLHEYFRSQLKAHGMIQSLSRKGNCYDNCIMAMKKNTNHLKRFQMQLKNIYAITTMSESNKKQNGCLL